jgi:large subunit ribosomal protein L27
MANTKAKGTSRNLRDSGPQYLGIKLADGQHANIGSILVRQRGSAILAGKNVKKANDDTLFSMIAGIVKFTSKRKTRYDGQNKTYKVVNVVPSVSA